MPNDIKKLRRVMMRANYLYGSNIILLRGANLSRREKQKVSLKLAWYYEHFRDMLASGVYRFSYFKKDGSIREARGTLCPDLIPEDQRPKNDKMVNEKMVNQSTFCYYDLNAQGWRSFCLDLFIGFVEQEA
jgi:hypothetical protein